MAPGPRRCALSCRVTCRHASRGDTGPSCGVWNTLVPGSRASDFSRRSRCRIAQDSKMVTGWNSSLGRSTDLPPPCIHKIERGQFPEPVRLKAQVVQCREVAAPESLLDLRAQQGGQVLGRGQPYPPQVLCLEAQVPAPPREADATDAGWRKALPSARTAQMDDLAPASGSQSLPITNSGTIASWQ